MLFWIIASKTEGEKQKYFECMYKKLIDNKWFSFQAEPSIQIRDTRILENNLKA